ncbi:MAG: minor capsid protein [Clostridia bacterium]|nr:minor capsid protein [Clostridia bacterium]
MEKDYWIKRFEYLEKMQMVNESKYMEELTKQYVVALEKIKKEIQQWFIRFSVNNQISLQEAKRWLDSNELNELKWDINEYIKYGKENGIDLIWRKELENASAKVHISRLNGLMLQIKEQVEKLYTLQEEDTSKFIIDSYKDTYYTTAYELQKGYNVGFNINVLDDILIKKLISKPWATDNMTFSDRIWRNKKELIHILENDLTQSILKGEAPDQVIEKISKTFKTSRSKAGRLVMTESAFFSSAARKDCFNNLWVQKYEIVATLDSHTSDICRELDGKVFDMKDYEPGVTAPPFHVWCRSTTAPWFEDEFEFGERAARNTNGKTYYIPGNITYDDWYKRFVA